MRLTRGCFYVSCGGLGETRSALQANGLHHTVLEEGKKYASLWDAGEAEVSFPTVMGGFIKYDGRPQLWDRKFSGVIAVSAMVVPW